MLSLGCERLPTPLKKKKGSGSFPAPRSGYATTITVFFCSFTRPVARLFRGGGQIGQILGPFMITGGLSCDRVEFGHFGGGQMTPLTPPPWLRACLLILQYPDHHQNLISSSLYYSGPVHKISFQSVHNFLAPLTRRSAQRSWWYYWFVRRPSSVVVRRRPSSSVVRQLLL